MFSIVVLTILLAVCIVASIGIYVEEDEVYFPPIVATVVIFLFLIFVIRLEMGNSEKERKEKIVEAIPVKEELKNDNIYNLSDVDEAFLYREKSAYIAVGESIFKIEAEPVQIETEIKIITEK